MSRRHYSSAFTATTLTLGVNTSDVTLSVAAVTGAPAVPWTGVLDRGTVSEELVTVTAVSGTSLTVTRGEDGQSAKAHTTGAAFEHVVSARDFDEANAHVNDTGDPHPQYLTSAEADALFLTPSEGNAAFVRGTVKLTVSTTAPVSGNSVNDLWVNSS